MYDLSQPLETGMQTYPGDPEVRVEPAATYPEDTCRVEAVSCGSHTGTHVDAPSHTEADGRSLDSYPISAFALDTIRVDCRDLGAREPIPAERVPDGKDAERADCVVFWTGWDEHWGSNEYLDHPSLPPVAAERCAEQGLAVGTDTLNPDPTPTENTASDEPEGFAAHHALLGADCLIFENLSNLGAVGEQFELRAYPIKLGGDGAPVRAVGVPQA
ncbi:cyclase family protein [Halolamina sp.]|jgi:kynurenine formamidase|uniref:cyclase family protein n=1 Tax=Halolamina sp. TaxID=1940283 RepID=UPI000223BEBC|nr:cyclase family protein [halophilic archaeon DL31]